MDAENVIQDLNRRFSVPLLEFHKRRIIFWYESVGQNGPLIPSPNFPMLDE